MTKLVSRICGKRVHPALIRINRLLMLIAVTGLGFQSTTLHAEEYVLPDTSVRVSGFNAPALTDMIKKHQLAPDDVRILAYDDEGDFVTEFVMLDGWDHLDQISGARDVCREPCEGLDNETNLVSLTILAGDDTQKFVFIDLSQLAFASDITGSFGLSGCIVDQIINEARQVDAETAPCLARLALGSFVRQPYYGRVK